MFFNFNFFNSSNNPITPLNRHWVLKPIKHRRDGKENFTGKINLPTFILGELSLLNYPTPYIFEISHQNQILKTKCGVEKFIESPNEVEIPLWLWQQLDIDSSSNIIISYVRIPKGKGIKILPHDVEFLDISDPKFELEESLRQYPCVSVGDEIRTKFSNSKEMTFTIVEVNPKITDSIYIIDTDLNVEFEKPIGYDEMIESQRTVFKYISIKTNKNKQEELVIDGFTLPLDFTELENVRSQNK